MVTDLIKPKGKGVSSMLPNGSVLSGVVLPSYDERRQIKNALKVETLTLVDDDHVAGERVEMQFFREDQSLQGRVDLEKAIYHQTTGLLVAKEPVAIRFDRLSADGKALVFSQQTNEGFFFGPTRTLVYAEPVDVAMIHPTPALRAASMAVAMTATAAMGQSAEPVDVPPSKVAEFREEVLTTRERLQQDLNRASEATQAVQEFLETSADNLPELPPAQPTAAEPPEELDMTRGPQDTLIRCDAGQYFHVDKGMLVFVKNVRVDSPDLELSGADELQVFFDQSKKPAAPGEAGKDEAAKVTAKLGDVKQIIAMGQILLKIKANGSNDVPIHASGGVLTYNAKSGEVVLSGGKPWVRRGRSYTRATQNNATLKIDRDSGNFRFDGPTELKIVRDDLEKKP